MSRDLEIEVEDGRGTGHWEFQSSKWEEVVVVEGLDKA